MSNCQVKSKCQMRNAQCGMPSAQCGMPNAQCGMPNAKTDHNLDSDPSANVYVKFQSQKLTVNCQMPNAQFQMRNAQLHKCQMPTGYVISTQTSSINFGHTAVARLSGLGKTLLPPGAVPMATVVSGFSLKDSC